MDEKFRAHVEALAPACQALLAASPISPSGSKSIPTAGGVYLFVEDGKPLYIGRSRQLRRRYAFHCSGRDNQATFAFILARQASNYTEVTYKKGDGTRAWLMRQELFLSAFIQSKERIRNMSFQWVVEEDPVRQALLEIYCSIALDTPHNSFKTT